MSVYYAGKTNTHASMHLCEHAYMYVCKMPYVKLYWKIDPALTQIDIKGDVSSKDDLKFLFEDTKDRKPICR